MLIRVGYKVEFEFEKAATVLCLGSIHPCMATRIRKPESLLVSPAVPVTEFLDTYGNRCSRMVVPAGRVALKNDAIVEGSEVVKELP